jgi:dienelactone hydrolase
MLDADDTPIAVDPSAKIPVTLVLPRTPPPPGGWPVVIFGHGTPTHRSYVMSVANELARAGMVVATIDAAEHGLRTPGLYDVGSEFEGSYSGPDGMADELVPLTTTLASLGFLRNFARARDIRAQTIVDYCQLRRLLANAQLDLSAAADQYGDVPLTIDPDRIGWAGVSFGGINGMILAAVEPEIRAFFLDVGGGLEWVTIGESPANLPQVDIALSEFGMPSSSAMRLSRFNPALTVLQMMFDGVDAASFAADATGPDLYVLEVHHDEQVPNYGTEVVAALMGLPQVSQSAVKVEGLAEAPAPIRGNAGGRTRALLVQTLAVHGRNWTSHTGTRAAETPFPREDQPIDSRIVYLDDPITVRQPVVATQRSAVHFFETAWADVAEITVDGMEFRIDFDDDGWDDADERAHSTDPFDPDDHP